MSFVGVAGQLAESRALLAIDLRGHGDSDQPPGPYTIDQHARDVARAMRSLDLGPSAIVGHSFGAYVATALAANEPGLVSRLLLVDGGHPPLAPAGVAPRVFAELAMAHSIDRVRRCYPTLDAYVESWRALPGLAGACSAWVDAFAAYDARTVPAGVRGKAGEPAVRAAYYEMLDLDAIERRLARVEVPIEIVRAAHGAARGLPPLLSDEVVARMRRHAPQAGLRTVEDASHYTILLGEAGATTVARLLQEVAS
jgi:pimeloyl-ACP methyl ester carboxylesterase